MNARGVEEAMMQMSCSLTFQKFNFIFGAWVIWRHFMISATGNSLNMLAFYSLYGPVLNFTNHEVTVKPRAN